MSANAPWSVKGIDAKAREVAKDLARRSGMTLGEWLNQMILQGEDVGALISKERAKDQSREPAQAEARPQARAQSRPVARGYAPPLDYDDEDEPYELTQPARRGPPYRDEAPRRPAAPFSSGAIASRDLRRRSIFEDRPRYDDGFEPEGNELNRVARALENLGTRIESSETRSAGAVRGVSHAVESLLSRLERSEAAQAETQSELQARLDEQTEAVERLSRTTEAHGPMTQRLEQAQRLIDAQAERLEGLSGLVREDRERLDRVEKQAVAPQVVDTVRAVEGALGKLANQLYEGDVRTREVIRDVREDMVGLSHRLAQMEMRDPERAAQGVIDKVVAQLAQRLEAAEAQTTTALKTLEQAFTALDGRLNRAEERGDVTDPQSVQSLKSLAADLQRKLEDSRAEVLNTLQGQTQATIEQAMTALGERIEQSEKHQAQALERMGHDVMRVADTLNRRMGEVAAANSAGLARMGQDINQRFSQTDNSHAQALERLGNEIARISERLSAKLSEQERRTAEVLDGVGEQVEQTTRHVHDNLESRIRDSEARTQKLLEDTRARIDQRLAQTFQNQALQTRAMAPEAPRAAEGMDGDLPNPFTSRPAPAPAVPLEAGDESDLGESALETMPFSRLGGAFDSPAPAEAVDDEEEIDLTGRLLQPGFDQAQFKPEFDPFDDEDLDGDLEPASPTHAAEDDADPFADIDHSRKISPRSASPLAGRQARLDHRVDDHGDDYGDDADEGQPQGRHLGFENEEAVSVSTRDALAAARAAVRAAAMDAPDRGPLGALKPGANRSRTAPEPRPRDGSAPGGSTFGQALKASAVAVGAVAVMAGGIWYVRSQNNAKPAPLPASDTPIAAAVLVPENGVSAEYNEAMKLIEAGSPGAIDRLKMVANQGYAPAQEQLGELYYSGKDKLLSPDKVQAREWTEKAARGGMAKAMRLLAQMYYNGQGTDADPSMAAVWMRRAADRGDVNSAYNLGLVYQSGTGVPMNPTEAYKWMMIAAKLGDAEAPATAAQLKKQLTEAQIAKVHDEVENFKALTDGEPLNASASTSASASNS